MQVQGPLVLGDSEPEPDLAVVAANAEKATTAALVVEVSDSSLDYDRTTKTRLYAEAGTPECPAGSVYKSTRRHLRGDVVDSPRAPCPVDVTRLFADL